MKRISHEAIKSCPDKGCKNIISLPDQNLPLKAAGLTPLWWPGPPSSPDQSERGWRGADQSERSILSQTLNCLEGRGEERRGHVLGSVLGLSCRSYTWPDLSSHQLVLQRQLGVVTRWRVKITVRDVLKPRYGVLITLLLLLRLVIGHYTVIRTLWHCEGISHDTDTADTIPTQSLSHLGHFYQLSFPSITVSHSDSQNKINL